MMAITNEEFIAYEKVRKSGVTNMFDVDFVVELSGLSREKVMEIMRDYSNQARRYLGKEPI
jgi:hypothetical protein